MSDFDSGDIGDRAMTILGKSVRADGRFPLICKSKRGRGETASQNVTSRCFPHRSSGIRSVINCIYGPAIGVRSKDRINGTRMTLMTRIIADKTPKDQCQSAESASSAFYESLH